MFCNLQRDLQFYDQALVTARSEAATATAGLEAEREGAEAEEKGLALRLQAVRIDEQVQLASRTCRRAWEHN